MLEFNLYKAESIKSLTPTMVSNTLHAPGKCYAHFLLSHLETKAMALNALEVCGFADLGVLDWRKGWGAGGL